MNLRRIFDSRKIKDSVEVLRVPLPDDYEAFHTKVVRIKNKTFVWNFGNGVGDLNMVDLVDQKKEFIDMVRDMAYVDGSDEDINSVKAAIDYISLDDDGNSTLMINEPGVYIITDDPVLKAIPYKS